MSWFNYIGLIVITVIMIPNIIYAVKHKDGFENGYVNKAAEIFEQIGRYGCLVLMIFNIPYTYFGFWFDGAIVVYVAVNSVLCVAYSVCWAVFRNKPYLPRAIVLSLLPSCVFVFGGVMLADIPLLVFAVIFAPCHILISCKNAQDRQPSGE